MVKNASKTKTTDKIDGKTVEQHRRQYGDKIKGKISCEKYTIAARTFVKDEMSKQVFDALVVPNAETLTPSTFDKRTDVVVAHMTGEGFAEAFGKTKVKGGNRIEQWAARNADVIFFPREEQVRIWWTMC